MTQLTVILWLLNILVDTAGQLSFKAAASQGVELDAIKHWKLMFRRPWLWLGITCYVAEFFVWLAFLTLLPLSSGVMLGSINIVAIMLAGRFLFNERLTPWRVAGISLISLGVLVVGLGE